MKMYQIARVALTLIGLLIVSCSLNNPPNAEVGFTPDVIPVRVSIDINGNVKLELSNNFVTPIGIFDITAEQNIASLRRGYDNRLLIIRVNNKTTIYELSREEKYKIDLSSDNVVYKQVSMEEENDGDIILEFESIPVTATTNKVDSFKIKGVRVGVADNKRLRVVVDLTQMTSIDNITGLYEPLSPESQNSEVNVLVHAQSDANLTPDYVSNKALQLADVSLVPALGGVSIHIIPKVQLYFRDIFFLPHDSDHNDDRLVIDLCLQKDCPLLRR